MAKIDFYRLDGSIKTGEKIQSIANCSDEEIKERLQKQSEFMQKQGTTRIAAQKVVLWGNMDKLNKSDTRNRFCEVAHNLILTQDGEFEYPDVYGQFLDCCDETVERKYAHSVLVETLSGCMNNGYVRLNKNERYQTIFVEEKQKSSTKEERTL
ncbi:MAG: hypothetical protein J6J24_00610 [Clostridia bacterium]|nr:hypothetical protein [Clostridia bacterium]